MVSRTKRYRRLLTKSPMRTWLPKKGRKQAILECIEQIETGPQGKWQSARGIQAFRHYYGIDTEPARAYQEVGDELQVSSSRARDLIRRTERVIASALVKRSPIGK